MSDFSFDERESNMIYNWHIKIFRNVENYSMDSDVDTSGKNKANEQKAILKGDEIRNNNRQINGKNESGDMIFIHDIA